MTPAQSPIIKRAQVQQAGASAAPVAPSAAPAPARCKVEKGATLVESGGRPVAIEVRCSCGETTLVELEFAAQGAATSAAPSTATTSTAATSTAATSTAATSSSPTSAAVNHPATNAAPATPAATDERKTP